MPRNTLVTDFDGTLTRRDFYEVVIERLLDAWIFEYWKDYLEGRKTHFEALHDVFQKIRVEEAVLLDAIRRMELEPRLQELVGKLDHAGWDVTIVSAGCKWYIKRLLHEAEVSVPLHANPGVFHPSTGLVMSLPRDSLFFDPNVGIDKVAVVRDALGRSGEVAFAGDGPPDREAALLVEPGRRFATGWLARKFDEEGVPYRPFERWSDVAEALL